MERIIQNTIRVLRGLFVFRILVAIFAALLLVSWSLIAETQPVTEDARAGLFMLPTLATTIFVLLPGLERRLGRRFLPIALTASIVAFSLEFATSYFEPGVHIVARLPTGHYLSQYWTPIEAVLVVMVPCVLAGAAYGIRGAAWAASLAVIIHLGLIGIAWLAGWPAHNSIVLLPLRVAGLLGFPLIAGYLADTWRREHLALRGANRRLRGYAAAIEELASSRERVRLARDLHDTLAHTLAALVVQLEAADTLRETDSAAAGNHLQKVKEQARSGLDEARRAILDLRFSPLEELGLVGALENLADQVRERSGLAVDLLLEAEVGPLSTAVRNGLYRIVEEALHNVEQHAEADRVLVQLTPLGEDRVELRVVDDGCGFDPAEVEPERVGLLGIFERAALLGGSARLQSAPGEGTTVIVEVGLE